MDIHQIISILLLQRFLSTRIRIGLKTKLYLSPSQKKWSANVRHHKEASELATGFNSQKHYYVEITSRMSSTSVLFNITYVLAVNSLD